jgi:hypothetical protein
MPWEIVALVPRRSTWLYEQEQGEPCDSTGVGVYVKHWIRLMPRITDTPSLVGYPLVADVDGITVAVNCSLLLVHRFQQRSWVADRTAQRCVNFRADASTATACNNMRPDGDAPPQLLNSHSFHQFFCHSSP